MKRILVALIAVVSGSAQAGVVYNWVQTSASETIRTTSGRIEFDQAAWSTGSINYREPQYACINSPVVDPSCAYFPNFPVKSFSFTLNVQGTPGGYLDYFVSSDGAGNAYDSQTFSPALWQFAIVPQGLTGSLDVYPASTTQLKMSGAGLDWTIDSLASDAGSPCQWANGSIGCTGSTGYWVLDPSSIVPAPASLLLVSAGILGLSAAGRRRITRRQSFQVSANAD